MCVCVSPLHSHLLSPVLSSSLLIYFPNYPLFLSSPFLSFFPTAFYFSLFLSHLLAFLSPFLALATTPFLSSFFFFLSLPLSLYRFSVAVAVVIVVVVVVVVAVVVAAVVVILACSATVISHAVSPLPPSQFLTRVVVSHSPFILREKKSFAHVPLREKTREDAGQKGGQDGSREDEAQQKTEGEFRRETL